MKKYILEYYAGNPDTITEYDDTTKNYIRSWNYNGSLGISFGWFQTTLDGQKEFVAKENTCHYDLTQEIANNIVGKAASSEYIMPNDIETLGNVINYQAAFKGRTFSKPKVITTWHKVSSEKLYEILENIGGVEKFMDYEYVFPTEYKYYGNDEIDGNCINVIDYINSNDQYIAQTDLKCMEKNFKDDKLVGKWIVDVIRKYNTPTSKLSDKTSKLGNMTIAQYNSLIHQEGKESKETINEYYAGDPDTVFETDYDFVINWKSEDARCFGFFPVSLDGKYQFLVGYKTHQELILKALEKIAGKALNHVDKDYLSNTAIGEFYRNSYGLGRYWEKHNIIAFWNNPSFELLADVVKRLEIDEKNCYIIAGESRNIMVSEYLSAKKDGETGTVQKERPLPITKKNISIISSYNQPNETWQSQKEKKGWKTLAQRNATIYQEEKEPKNTIKENDMKENKYQKEFSNYIEIMNEALKRNDFGAYNAAKRMLDETIEDNKHENALLSEMKTNNFGILNHIFEQQLPTLFKTNKKAVRDVVKLIKEDNNLKNEFAFYNAIKTQYKGNAANIAEAKDVLEKLADISVKKIDQKTVRESNKKLRKVMMENNIVPSDFIDDENRKLYESGHVILTHKKTTANMIPLIESYHTVCQYMEKHKNDMIKESKNVDDLINEFEDKLKTNLNESEMSFVQQITDFRSPIAEQRKEKLFNKLKEDCITAITSMLKEDSNNEELKGLSNQLNEMVFDKNNIVKDIAKLLEIRDILMDD